MYLLHALKILRIDHGRDAAENASRPVSRRDSGRFHQVFNCSGSGENLVDIGGRYMTEAGYSPHVHSSVTPPVPLPLPPPWINYARYLHTKRPGKIKNTNSERGGNTLTHLARSSSRSPLYTALSLAHQRARVSFLWRSAVSLCLSFPPLFSSYPPRIYTGPAAFPEAVATLSHYSAGPPIL